MDILSSCVRDKAGGFVLAVGDIMCAVAYVSSNICLSYVIAGYWDVFLCFCCVCERIVAIDIT